MSEIEDAIYGYMKRVKKAECYTEHTKVYAPTCYGGCVPAVNKLISEINKIFKGSTVYDAVGSWLNPDTGELETEPVKVIEVASRCTNPAKAAQFGKAISDFGAKAQQHSLSIDRQDFFIARSPEVAKTYVKVTKRRKT